MKSKKLKRIYPDRGAKWVFTWSGAKDSNFCAIKIFNIKNLILLSRFSKRYCKIKDDGFMCQLEKDLKHNKLYMQDRLELLYGRVYKSVLLKYFNEVGINSLFLAVEKDQDKSKYYVEKLESRIAGPFNNKDLIPYPGNDVVYIKKKSKNMATDMFFYYEKKNNVPEKLILFMIL